MENLKGEPPKTQKEGEIDNPEFYEFAMKQIDEFHAHNRRVMYEQKMEKRRLKREKNKLSPITIIIALIIIILFWSCTMKY